MSDKEKEQAFVAYVKETKKMGALFIARLKEAEKQKRGLTEPEQVLHNVWKKRLENIESMAGAKQQKK